MRLSFWTWVVDVLDACRHWARHRKLQALSDTLISHRYDWMTKEPNKTLGYQMERHRRAYSQFPIVSGYTELELLKDNDERMQ